MFIFLNTPSAWKESWRTYFRVRVPNNVDMFADLAVQFPEFRETI